MSVTRRIAMVAMLLLAAVLGCGREPTRPVVPFVMMTLSATPSAGSPASPVTFNLKVTNAGPTQVWYIEGCGCDAMDVTVLGPDGNAVLLSDPWASYPYPLCPCGPVSFAPGTDLSGGGRFTGTLFAPSPVSPSPSYAAPAGRYTVIAKFWYEPGKSLSLPQVELTRRTTFDWHP